MAKAPNKITGKVGFFDQDAFEDLCIAVADVEKTKFNKPGSAGSITVQKVVDPHLRKRWAFKHCTEELNINHRCNMSVAESKSSESLFKNLTGNSGFGPRTKIARLGL